MFTVTWTTLQNHLLEVDLTQNQETMALRMLTTVGLFYFIHVWRLAWIEVHWNSIQLRAQSHMSSHYTWGFVTTLHDFGGVVGRPLDTFFWALTVSWSLLLARVVALKIIWDGSAGWLSWMLDNLGERYVLVYDISFSSWMFYSLCHVSHLPPCLWPRASIKWSVGIYVSQATHEINLYPPHTCRCWPPVKDSTSMGYF
jgi:hypothetical protein